MKVGLTIVIVISSLAGVFAMEGSMAAPPDSTVKILVLPAYDEIASASISPNTRKFIETALTGKKHLLVIPFPFRELMGVSYQMAFDKRYCKGIVKKVDCDIIIMTQIITDNERKPGVWPWAYKIRVYNTRSDQQLNSIQGEKLKAEDVEKDIISKLDKLISDIGLSFKVD